MAGCHVEFDYLSSVWVANLEVTIVSCDLPIEEHVLDLRAGTDRGAVVDVRRLVNEDVLQRMLLTTGRERRCLLTAPCGVSRLPATCNLQNG